VERLVFSTPTSSTLSLLSYATAPPTIGAAPSPPPTQVDPCACGIPNRINVPPVQPAPAVTAPVAQPPAPALAPTSTPGTSTVALSEPDDRKERARAIGMLLLLLAAVAWLVVTERGGHVVTNELGVGRFRSARSGPTPTI
jgi:hypothetical protein